MVETIDAFADNSITSGHGGGDEGLVHTLAAYLAGTYEGKSIPTIAESYYNHLLTFAAEESRLQNRVIDMEEYIREIEAK